MQSRKLSGGHTQNESIVVRRPFAAFNAFEEISGRRILCGSLDIERPRSKDRGMRMFSQEGSNAVLDSASQDAAAQQERVDEQIVAFGPADDTPVRP